MVLEDLGPSFVKMGQMFSSRVDLLPPEYVAELRKLTDHVQPFPRQEAERYLRQEWGERGASALEQLKAAGGLPEEPVAAASLCQVYRLDIREWGSVAVKVQRPGIQAQICADLYLLRLMAVAGVQLAQFNTDFVALVDEYGMRLVDELDFCLEARSALEFQASAQRLGLDSVCTVAQPIVELTTRRVLVTRWVAGEHLEATAARDPGEARRLQGVALTAYMAMLLETGALHADPHAGNLLRAEDGRLVILDWGLVARISPTLRRSLLRYVGHVLARDYQAVPADLVALGFIAESRRGTVAEAEVAHAISDVFRQLASGGSARRRVAEVLPLLGGIRKRYGSIGQLPAGFVYILRAFSILEGHGLRLEKEYRIVEDCYPYFAGWAARAEGPEAQELLRAVLYGAKGHDQRPVPDAGQAMALLRGLTASLRLGRAGTGGGAGEAAEAGEAMEMLDVWLRQLSHAHVLRDVALAEAARAADVVIREALEGSAGLVGSAGAVPQRTAEDRAVLASLAELAALAADAAATEAELGAPEALLREARGLLDRALAVDAAKLAQVVQRAGPLLLPALARFAALLLQRVSRRVGTASSSATDSSGAPAA